MHHIGGDARRASVELGRASVQLGDEGLVILGEARSDALEQSHALLRGEREGHAERFVEGGGHEVRRSCRCSGGAVGFTTLWE